MISENVQCMYPNSHMITFSGTIIEILLITLLYCLIVGLFYTIRSN